MRMQQGRRLSEFSTFGIGGPIDFFAEISSIEEMREAFLWAKENGCPFLLVGKGSNCLFSDAGFRGLVLLNKIDTCDWEEDGVCAGAGYSFSLLGSQAARKNFSGLEFAAGIPASVGGAVYMNAGANGGETSHFLRSVLYMDAAGEVREYKREELTFSYRTSPFQKMKGAILAASFALQASQEARGRQLQIIEHRMKTQPLKEKSAGCVFRNPGGALSAGALIEQAGLKGVSVGDAAVSEVHANFIINRGNATARDVEELIQLVQATVFKEKGVSLELEVKVIR